MAQTVKGFAAAMHSINASDLSYNELQKQLYTASTKGHDMTAAEHEAEAKQIRKREKARKRDVRRARERARRRELAYAVLENIATDGTDDAVRVAAAEVLLDTPIY